jgi:hypothetical protein
MITTPRRSCLTAQGRTSAPQQVVAASRTQEFATTIKQSGENVWEVDMSSGGVWMT